MGPLQSPPRVTWSTLASRLASRWRPGEHVTIVAPAGHGKTHLALELADMCRFVLVLATKRKDPLVSELAARGYVVVSTPDGVLWAEDQPVTPKVVVWPQFGDKVGARQRLVLQSAALREVIDWADKTGGWTIVADETMWLHDNLRLERELSSIWYQGRTQGISMIALMQRPARVPRLAFSQATYLFVGKYNDKRDIDALREISSVVPRELVEQGIRSLSKERHEFLFVDCVRDEAAIVVAPPR